VRRPDNGGGRAPRPGLNALDATDESRSGVMVPRDRDRLAAQARIRRRRRQLDAARRVHQAMPLTVHYGPRPLLDVPLGWLDARGRRVA